LAVKPRRQPKIVAGYASTA